MAQADWVHDAIKIIFWEFCSKKDCITSTVIQKKKTEKDHKEDFQESVHYKRHNP